jgi:integrase
VATIEKRSETSYRITISCGYDKNGKQIRKKKTITLSAGLTERQQQKEIQTQSVLFEKEVQNGTFLDGNKIRLDEYVQIWLINYAEKELAPKTIERYRTLLVRINQSLGDIKLCKLQPQNIRCFMNSLSDSGRNDDRYILKDKYISRFKDNRHELSESGVDSRTISNILKGGTTDRKTAYKIADFTGLELSAMFTPQNTKDQLSSQTLLHHFRLLSTILNAAVRDDLLLNNPAERVKPPRVEQREIQSLNDDEVIKMLELLASAPLKYQAAVYIAVFGGLRLGEVMGLKWTDIDFPSGKLSVTKSRQYVKGQTIEKSPKNDSSIRELKLPDIALAKLRELQKEQLLERFQLGSQWEDSGNIFIQWNGVPMFPSTIGHWFTKWIAGTDLPEITFHGLRHTTASLLIAHGTNIATVSKRLGHSRISTTSDIYTHAISKMDEEAASTLDTIFTRKKCNLA